MHLSCKASSLSVESRREFLTRLDWILDLLSKFASGSESDRAQKEMFIGCVSHDVGVNAMPIF